VEAMYGSIASNLHKKSYGNRKGGCMIIKGFRFGILLQLAIGPMCLLVFNTSASDGILSGLILVTAITLVDGLYILLSGLGIVSIMNNIRIQRIIKLFGCAVLMLFGISMITGALGIDLIPSFLLFLAKSQENIFLKGLLLTASNPLTILFWSGVFSTQVIQHKRSKLQLFYFGLGCILSTLSFLSIIALLGTIVSSFLPQNIMSGMNIVVGVLLILFGLKLLISKRK
jgi:threonine/homoserine/homoserine lactone efflux protein